MTSEGRFKGRSVVITGAAGGIGFALATAFAEEGAQLSLVDVADCSSLIAQLGQHHRAWALDLTDVVAIQNVISDIGEQVGIDILINNAGLGMIFPAELPDVERWDLTQAINLRAPWLVSAAAFEFLKRSGHGRVVHLASKAGVVGVPEHAAYGASKAGLIGLAKVQAVEWAPFGITVNAISPTVVETPMAMVGWSGEKGEMAKKDIPVGRFAKPSEIAEAAMYLASDGAAMVTGTNLLVDGGFTAK